MSLDEAKGVIRLADPPFMDSVMAAIAITNSPESSFSDLLECLRFAGPPSEMAACVLYTRTRRPHGDVLRGGHFSTDYGDWEQYLRSTGRI